MNTGAVVISILLVVVIVGIIYWLWKNNSKSEYGGYNKNSGKSYNRSDKGELSCDLYLINENGTKILLCKKKLGNGNYKYSITGSKKQSVPVKIIVVNDIEYQDNGDGIPELYEKDDVELPGITVGKFTITMNKN
jgi:hypothetical protein